MELDAGVAGRFRPGQLPSVPFHERLGVGGDVEVLVQTGIGLADLGLAVLEQQPVPLVGSEAGEVQPDNHAVIGESVATKRVAHGPQRDEWIEVFGRDLEPTSAPLPEGLADLEQIVSRGRELVPVTAPLRLGCGFDDPEVFEVLEPLREEGGGESGRTLEDLAEGLTAQVEVANDQRRPTLSEDFGATGDRAVLAIGPHDFKCPARPEPREVQIP